MYDVFLQLSPLLFLVYRFYSSLQNNYLMRFNFKPLFKKQESRGHLAGKETEFLWRKQSGIGKEGFDSLKVIGRGAFDSEVSN